MVSKSRSIAAFEAPLVTTRLEKRDFEKLERLAAQFTEGNRSAMIRRLIQEAQVLEIKTKGVIVELVANE